MDITPLLPKAHVLLRLTDHGQDRRALLEELCGPLVASGIVEALPEFLDAVERREQQVTTQASWGVAFPHARNFSIKRLGLVAGRSAAPGVPFSSHSDSLCRLFFLIAVPGSSPTAHIPLLKHLSQAVKSASLRDRILSARTEASLIKELS